MRDAMTVEEHPKESATISIPDGEIPLSSNWQASNLPSSIIAQVQPASTIAPKKKNILLIGASGTGKSTMAASAFTEGPVHFLDLDNKFAQLAPELLTKYPDGVFTFQEFRGTLTGNAKMKVVASPDQKEPKRGFDHESRPKVYQKLLDTINAYVDVCEKEEIAGRDPAKILPFTTLVLDSYTRLREHLRATLRKEQGHAIVTLSDWGVVLDNDVAFMNGFLSLPCNCIVICHETPVYNKVGNLVKLIPAIQGQFKDTVASHFQEVFFLKAEANRDKATRDFKPTVHWAFGKPDEKLACARSSLTDFRRVPTDLGGIFSGKYRGDSGKEWFQRVEGNCADGQVKISSTGGKKVSFGHGKGK